MWQHAEDYYSTLQVLKDKDPRVVPAAYNNKNDEQVPLPRPPPSPLPAATSTENNNIARQPAPHPPLSHNVNLASSNNGRNRYEGIVGVDVNTPVPFQSWRMTCLYTGWVFTPSCDVQGHNVKSELCPIDFFMAGFLKNQLKFMVDHMSALLQLAGKPPTSMGEIFKWTWFEFGNCTTLWYDDSGSQYVPAPHVGTRTGMSCERCD